MKTTRSVKECACGMLTAAAALAAFSPRLALADGWAFAGFHKPSPPQYGEWQMPLNVEKAYQGTHPELNTEFADFCPAVAGDGRTLYFVSVRPGGLGGSDVWISRRNSVHEPWGQPENPGAPVNSAGHELCSTPYGSHGLLLVSNRDGGCGGTDIYFTWQKRSGWAEPRHLDCDVNSPGDEMAPTIFTYFDLRAPWLPAMELYFSSNRAGGFAPEPPNTAPDGDIYYAQFRRDGSLGSPELVPGVNTAGEDQRPTLRVDGLEIFFDSNRAGGFGILDIWTSTRRSVRDPWNPPVNLGTSVNTAGGESRPSLSRDGTQLYIASTRPGGDGQADLWIAEREKQRGRAHAVPSKGDER